MRAKVGTGLAVLLAAIAIFQLFLRYGYMPTAYGAVLRIDRLTTATCVVAPVDRCSAPIARNPSNAPVTAGEVMTGETPTPDELEAPACDQAAPRNAAAVLACRTPDPFERLAQ
jgi:hypothetical protein